MLIFTTENFIPFSRCRSCKSYIIIDSKQSYVTIFFVVCLNLQNCTWHTQQMFLTNFEHPVPTAAHFRASNFLFYTFDVFMFLTSYIYILIDEAFVVLWTLISLTWRIWWAPNNVSKWQMGFNLAFKRLIRKFLYFSCFVDRATLYNLVNRTNLCTIFS
jgi:hypothetical protein